MEGWDFSRRGFISGSAAFALTGATGRMFAQTLRGREVKLRIGIVSDIHITTDASCEHFEKALTSFRNHGVDGVLIAGDMADYGVMDQLLRVGATWRKVFPGDKGLAGKPVTKLFVYGNHDIDGWNYGITRKHYPDIEKNHPEQIIGHRRDLAWKEAFDEEYAPIWLKDIRGFKFVGVHHGGYFSKTEIGEFLEAHRKELEGAKPFFYTQHYHPRGTCSAPWTWGQDEGYSTAALSRFPNAIAFTGHSHTPLVDDRTIWQGAFTSVGTASLRYLIPFGGRENSTVFGVPDIGDQQMARMGCRDGKHGQIMSVYDDCIHLQRREFTYGESLGADWVIPLTPDAFPMGNGGKPPLSFAVRAEKERAPEFAKDAKITVTQGKGNSRKGKQPIEQVTVRFPTVLAKDTGVRAFDYEVAAEIHEADVVRRIVKYVYSPRYYLGEGHDAQETSCVFARSDFTHNGDVVFHVRPRASFGTAGAEISCKYRLV